MPLTLLALMAATLDYTALATECRGAMDDVEVQAYLEGHLTEAREIEKLRALIISATQGAALHREEAEQARRSRAMATISAATGDPVIAAMGRSMQDQVSPVALEQMAREADEMAKDGLVELVQRYRSIRTSIYVAKKLTSSPKKKR